MKKILIALILVAIVFSVCSCSKTKKDASASTEASSDTKAQAITEYQEPTVNIPEDKNGVVHDNDGETRYYVEGVAQYAGLVKDTDGSIYYFNSTKKAVKNCTYEIGEAKANYEQTGLHAGTYSFDENGKMIVAE